MVNGQWGVGNGESKRGQAWIFGIEAKLASREKEAKGGGSKRGQAWIFGIAKGKAKGVRPGCSV